MKSVSIRELHARTGELVRSASRHGEILVTDHGRLIAKIVPESAGGKPPYFLHRDASEAFRRLDSIGSTGGGTDSTRTISENREDRV